MEPGFFPVSDSYLLYNLSHITPFLLILKVIKYYAVIQWKEGAAMIEVFPILSWVFPQSWVLTNIVSSTKSSLLPCNDPLPPPCLSSLPNSSQQLPSFHTLWKARQSLLEVHACNCRWQRQKSSNLMAGWATGQILPQKKNAKKYKNYILYSFRNVNFTPTFTTFSWFYSYRITDNRIIL